MPSNKITGEQLTIEANRENSGIMNHPEMNCGNSLLFFLKQYLSCKNRLSSFARKGHTQNSLRDGDLSTGSLEVFPSGNPAQAGTSFLWSVRDFASHTLPLCWWVGAH